MRRFSTLMILSLLVVAFLAMSAFGASSYTPAKRVDNSLVQRAVHYSMPYPDESNIDLSSSGKVGQSLGLVNPPSSSSPGRVIGYTWYDYQSNGTIGRQVDWGYDATNGYMVHFTWMYLPTRTQVDRAYAYTAYFADAGVVPAFSPIQGSGEYAGYVGIDAMNVTEDGGHGAVVGGHNNPGTGVYASELYYETDEPGVGFFASKKIIDSVQCYETQAGPEDACAIWPTFRYQEVSGQDPVTHVFATASLEGLGVPHAVIYFRKVGFAEEGDWDYPPYIVDTVLVISQDVACSNTTGKIALAWNANLVETNLAACDICSDNEGDSAVNIAQWENDLYYMVNTNYGDPNSWNTRENLTKNLRDEEGYRPYTDLSILMGSNDDVHIAWSASIWLGRADAVKDRWACRLFAWSENNGFTTGDDGFDRANMQTVADLNYAEDDYPDCGSGGWNMLASKMSISECNNRLYYMWVQFNDVANGVTDDCAARAELEDDIMGSANGELFLSVSTGLQGCLWDAPRNLTNSYTPGCDSLLGTGGRCDSDNWPSMARHGSNHAGAKPVDSIIVDPTGGYNGGYYLPVEYIADQDPGGIVQDEGTWQQADVVWFQLACVEPEDTKTLIPSISEIGFPAYCKPGGTLCSTMVVENAGNQTTSFTVVAATSTHASGALTVSPGSGSILAGCSSVPASITICMANGMITPPAGTSDKLEGTITFSGDFVNSPRVLPISFIVADTIIPQKWDTLYCVDGSNALALAVGNNGNYGHSGGATGKIGMDYWLQDECAVWDEETEDNDFLGDSRVYLYDGSKIICKNTGGEIDCNYSMFDYDYGGGGPDDGFYDGGFFPRETPAQTYPIWMTPQDTPDCQFNVYEFVNRDTSILIEQVTIAPNVVSPQYMLQATKFSNLTDTDITGLAIGEGIDWDIPSDSAAWNGSGFDSFRNLMYQYGEEYGQDSITCTDNSRRFGGVAVLDIFEDGDTSGAQYGMYAMDNLKQVYPLGHFHPDSLMTHMVNMGGFTVADTNVGMDLHLVTTYRPNHTLAASGGNLIVYTLLATEYKGGSASFLNAVDEGKQWYEDNFVPAVDPNCCRYVADVNHDGVDGDPSTGIPNITDLIFMVTYMFQEGPCPVCNTGPNCIPDAVLPEADINCSGNAIPDITDLIYMVTYMFQEGPAPSCWDDQDTPACNK